MKRIPRRTIAWWIRCYGMKIEWWNTSSKFGLVSLGFQVYDQAGTHTFYF